MNIYLAGKVHPNSKYTWPKGVEPAIRYKILDDKDLLDELKASGISITAPSAKDHDVSGFDGNTDIYRQEFVQYQIIEPIGRCDAMVAIVDDAEAYGTICEIGFASALGKPVLLLMVGTDGVVHKEDEGGFDVPSKFQDAYWLCANFPNVMGAEVKTVDEAKTMMMAFIHSANTLMRGPVNACR